MRARGLPIVYVFARAPVLGTVKTRLAADIGAVQALAFYRRITHALIRRIGRDRRWRTVLALTPHPALRAHQQWPSCQARIGQRAGDLGRRMARVLDAEPRVPALVIGSDVPDIAAFHVARAFAALGKADLVFGPAFDGGYWLVGRRPGLALGGLFAGVRWSSPHALTDTLANVPAHRKAALLAPLEDIDDAPAYDRWRARCQLRPNAAG